MSPAAQQWLDLSPPGRGLIRVSRGWLYEIKTGARDYVLSKGRTPDEARAAAEEMARERRCDGGLTMEDPTKAAQAAQTDTDAPEVSPVDERQAALDAKIRAAEARLDARTDLEPTPLPAPEETVRGEMQCRFFVVADCNGHGCVFATDNGETIDVAECPTHAGAERVAEMLRDVARRVKP